METNRKAVGTYYEDIAARFLEDNGMSVIARNFRCRSGEIDIVALDGDCLCFTEVKYRKNDAYGRPAAAVTLKKQLTIIRVSEYFIMKRNMYSFRRRYDVVEILGDKISIIKNAFGG